MNTDSFVRTVTVSAASDRTALHCGLGQKQPECNNSVRHMVAHLWIVPPTRIAGRSRPGARLTWAGKMTSKNGSPRHECHSKTLAQTKRSSGGLLDVHEALDGKAHSHAEKPTMSSWRESQYGPDQLSNVGGATLWLAHFISGWCHLERLVIEWCALFWTTSEWMDGEHGLPRTFGTPLAYNPLNRRSRMTQSPNLDHRSEGL